jgi:DNA (cytosine-5)-methyltransferase 1
MENKTITTVELFAGIGGFRLACDRLGIQTIWANDINELAATVYRDRFFIEVDLYEQRKETIAWML